MVVTVGTGLGPGSSIDLDLPERDSDFVLNLGVAPDCDTDAGEYSLLDLSFASDLDQD